MRGGSLLNTNIIISVRLFANKDVFLHLLKYIHKLGLLLSLNKNSIHTSKIKINPILSEAKRGNCFSLAPYGGSITAKEWGEYSSPQCIPLFFFLETGCLQKEVIYYSAMTVLKRQLPLRGSFRFPVVSVTRQKQFSGEILTSLFAYIWVTYEQAHLPAELKFSLSSILSHIKVIFLFLLLWHLLPSLNYWQMQAGKEKWYLLALKL